MGLRLEDIHDELLVLESHPDSIVQVKVSVSELLGAETIIYADVAGNEFVAKVGVNQTYAPEQSINLSFNLNKAHFFNKEDETVIK